MSLSSAAPPAAADPHAPYTLYKADVSYFSGKLEAYMRYKMIPHQALDADMQVMNGEIYPSTGARKVPAVRTADGKWLFDTTPMIEWFEERYPAGPVVPADRALAFVAYLLEDYADEWLWRPAMWWRWEYAPSRRAVGWRIGALSNLGSLAAGLIGAHFARRQRREWLWDDGVSRANAGAVRDLYLDELTFLQPLLERRPYILGSHPSVADFGYFGPMFRHFGNDPDPAEVMRRRAPAVYEWAARLWNATTAKLGSEQTWIWPAGAFWQPLLRRIARDYLPYLHQNAVAFRDGKERFDFKGDTVSFAHTVTTDYRVWCREVLQGRWQALSLDERERVNALFESAGGLEALELDGIIESGMAARFVLPRPAPAAAPKRPPVRIALFGQPRN
jgi:glutathione S-transferase